MHQTPSKITPEVITSHGFKAGEYERLLESLGREPNFTELGIFSVMWSEHCSYKSSKVWLKTLPTTGPRVICGPGENAGVIDIGDGQAVIFKMESHNHPSFIEPYQGAATGVGGIMRDVFTMGARPIANMNALRFGSPDHPKTRHLVAGVVAGIGDYGNCVGVPTVGGETNFDARYNGNILVNAMCVGLARTDKIFYSAASGAGNPVVYVGSKTGRDGIHGATMASAEFDEKSDEKRPTVQVGDPFTEKLLIEACLELMAGDAILAIQDMGAAGLTSSSIEMASKGGSGVEMWLERVPQRETSMTAYEIMLSESQERMLMVLRPGSEEAAEAIFHKWELDFAVVGVTTDTGRIVIKHHGAVEADIPTSALADKAPEYNRPWTPKAPAVHIKPEDVPAPESLGAALKALMASPHLASRRWIWEQYDHMVMGDTVVRPGGDAAVVRVDGSNKALALTCDVTPRYCYADPYEGGKQAVAETWRNLTAVGADPIGITNCLNFGNPERPEIMGEFAECIRGMADACRALDFPVVSGNVSLYNETNGVAIPPTPAIGGVGLIPDIANIARIGFATEGETLILVGATWGHLGQSLYQELMTGKFDGLPPQVDLAAELRVGTVIRELIRKGLVTSVHDVSDGGMLVAIAEMALASGIGANLIHLKTDEQQKSGLDYFADIFDAEAQYPLLRHVYSFSEDQGRYLVTVTEKYIAPAFERLIGAGLQPWALGKTGGNAIVIPGEEPIKLAELRALHEGWLPQYMDGKSI